MCIEMDCYCDYKPAEFYHVTRPLARKEHKCYECGYRIQPGERYERVRTKWEGEVVVCKTCVYCLEMRDFLETRLDCFCWHHGNLIEDMIETVRDDPHNPPGLGMAFGRLYVISKRRRQCPSTGITSTN